MSRGAEGARGRGPGAIVVALLLDALVVDAVELVALGVSEVSEEVVVVEVGVVDQSLEVQADLRRSQLRQLAAVGITPLFGKRWYEMVGTDIDAC